MVTRHHSFNGRALAAAIITALSLAFVPAAAVADDGNHGPESRRGSGGASRSDARWDFTLPTLDGTRFVQVSKISGPVLVNFWGVDCPPCLAELPRIEAFAKRHPSVTVLLVSTDGTTAALQAARQFGLSLPILRPGANVSALMREAGNRVGGLPFSVALHNGVICDRHLGELSDTQLASWQSRCLASSAPSPANP